MSDIRFGQVLHETARTYASTEAGAPPHQALSALLELGRLAEGDPESAALALDGLSSTEGETLWQWAVAERNEDTAYLRTQLASLQQYAALLEVPPLLTDDPDTAEAAAALALSALNTRERIHRLGLAATWLAPGDGAEAGGSAALVEADEVLQASLPRWTVLAAERARQADRLPVDEREAHWWWTTPVHEAPQAEEDAEDAKIATVAPLQQWVAQRMAAAPDGNRLHLTSDEATALLSTPRGQRVAAYLGDRLEFDLEQAVAPGTLAEALATTAAVAVQPRRRAAYGAARGWRQAPQRPERLAAATGAQAELTGLDALAGVYCRAAELLPGLGVVAHGSLDVGGDEKRVWLIIADAAVASLRIGDGDTPFVRALWAPGGLAVDADALFEPFEVAAEQDDEGHAEIEHHWVETGPNDLEPNLLTRLLRHVYAEQFDAARRDWAELLASSDAEAQKALSGLRLALEALVGGGWA